MFVVRKMGLKVLPMLVLLWTTLAIVGGAFHPVNETKATQDATVKTRLGLCAVSVALLLSTGVRRRMPVSSSTRKLLPKNPGASLREVTSKGFSQASIFRLSDTAPPSDFAHITIGYPSYRRDSPVA